MTRKSLLNLLWYIMATFIIMLAVAGGIYLIGNVLIGWTWLTFDICVSFSGTLILIIFMILIIILEILEKKDDE